MRRSVAAALTSVVALSTVLSVGPAVTATAGTGRPAPQAASPGQRTGDGADRALARAQDILAGRRATERPDGTLALRDLFRALPELDPTQRKQARGILARPTDGSSDYYGDGYTTSAKRTCDGHFCIHWVSSTADAPPSRAWVLSNLDLMNRVWRTEVGAMGYRRPLSDGTRGGSSKFDVYLKELGGQGLYGYCAPERQAANNQFLASGYCVLDNDFARAQYGAAPMASARVTAAHEFFHAIQFAYDYAEDHWMMEATSTWMEERFADNVNDNRQYLRYGQVSRPGQPLDTYSTSAFNQYGNWPFFEYLSQRFGNGIVRQAWEKAGAYAGAPDKYSTRAVKAVLAPHGGFGNVFRAYAAGNTVPGRTYSEGGSWPRAQITRTWRLSRASRTAARTQGIDHLASRNLVIKPDDSLDGRRWMARVTINAPARRTGPAAYLIVKKKNGPWVTKGIPLTRDGYGKVSFSFSRRSVKSATITLANVSTRFDCWQNANWSCQGYSKDNDRPFAFKATVFKR